MELPITNNPPVCRRLRSKGTPGVNYTSLVDFDDGFISTATFWCLETGEAVGPDDDQVHPHVCVAPRECYRAPREDDAA